MKSELQGFFLQVPEMMPCGQPRTIKWPFYHNARPMQNSETMSVCCAVPVTQTKRSERKRKGGVSNNMFVWRSKLITVWMSHSLCYSLLEPQRGSLLYCEYMNTDVWLSSGFSLDPECISADCKHARSCVWAQTYRNYEGQNLKCAATLIPPDTIQPHSHN